MGRGAHIQHQIREPMAGFGRRPVLHGILAIFTAALVASSALSSSAREDKSILVFAAASLSDAMTAIGDAYTERTGIRISFSFAASSALARQIESGAPAELFVSANRLWMDRLDSAGLIAPLSRSDIAGNRLALIASRDSKAMANITASLEFSALLDGGRLAMGDPDHVPAGIYGRAALESLGFWADVNPWLARTGDVRGALALVARGETPLGIVYATDAAITGDVRLLGLFPADSHPPIVYPAALTDGATDDARRFLDFLRAPEARAIFRARGFADPAGDDLDPAS